MTDEGQPLLRVVRGAPTAEELAALIAVVTARSARAPAAAGVGSAWSDRSRLLRRCPPAAAGAWRQSAWQT